MEIKDHDLEKVVGGIFDVEDMHAFNEELAALINKYQGHENIMDACNHIQRWINEKLNDYESYGPSDLLDGIKDILRQYCGQ